MILSRLAKFEYIYIKTIPYPDKLGKIEEIYKMLQPFGVVEVIGSRRFIYEPDRKNPADKIKVMLIRWDIIPKLQAYREELANQIKEERQ